MPRLSPVLLLLLGLASPGTSQAPNTIAWNLSLGDFTLYGHTTYTPTFVLLPRVVYDTAHGVDSLQVVDSVRPTPKKSAGFAAGLSRWPADFYCSSPTSAAMQPLGPHELLERLQLADRCGVRLVVVPPRRFLTTNGRTEGDFSVDSAKALMDRYAEVLPPDTLRKYQGTILGLNLADDYNCKRCWGGSPITQAEIAEWATYARAKLPGVPLGVRMTPDWVEDHPALAPLLDYAWAQYNTRRGDPQGYYDNAATIARRLGLRMVMALNVKDCGGVRTSACSAEDLLRLGTIALKHPGSCAFIGWRYDEALWERADIRQAWDGLMAIAKGRRAEDCRRASPS